MLTQKLSLSQREEHAQSMHYNSVFIADKNSKSFIGGLVAPVNDSYTDTMFVPVGRQA